MPLLHCNVSKDAGDASVDASGHPGPDGRAGVSRGGMESIAAGAAAGMARGMDRGFAAFAASSTTPNAIAPSLPDRHRLGHLDSFAGDAATIGKGLHPGEPGGVECPAIGRIDIAGELETLRRPDLDQEQDADRRGRS